MERDGGPELLDFPHNWDQLEESSDPLSISSAQVMTESEEAHPLVLSLFAATWADAVTLVALATTSLLVLVALGYDVSINAFPWAVGLSLLWWSIAASATIVIRRGTPGMLMAGIILSRPVQPKRVPWVLIMALVQCASFGVLAFLGPRRSLLRLVSGVPLQHTG